MHSTLLIAVASLAALFVTGVIITLNSLRNAPEGHEDADGFHYGDAPRAKTATESAPLAA